ncbi:MAG TPA: agmatinase [Firmicutes bacterium]|nr:agmatinase [Bacillota bacterium]HHY99066.1 agmatinase [Bacillota bacterium]
MRELSPFLERQGHFFASGDSYNTAKVVITGIPMDFTASWRAGARAGPSRIRQVSDALEDFSPALKRSLIPEMLYDAGDLVLPIGNVGESLSCIERTTRIIVNGGKFPIFIGGEHLVTFPVIKAMREVYPDLLVVQLDAHLDLRDNYLGEVFSHATVMRRVIETVGEGNLFQCGIRSGTADEFQKAERIGSLIEGKDIVESVSHILRETGQRPVYVTLDIDVVDPAYAPGTGTPEPGGCTTRELFSALYLLFETKLVGFDLVEVAPTFDHSDITSLLAAKVIREVVLSRVGK